MSNMFSECSSLKELNLNNFNTSNVTNMRGMFYKCSSVKELIISNFNINNVADMLYMLDDCSDELIKKIREQNNNLINI